MRRPATSSLDRMEALLTTLQGTVEKTALPDPSDISMDAGRKGLPRAYIELEEDEHRFRGRERLRVFERE